MSAKKSSRGAVSNTSLAVSPAISAATQATQKSSILKSAFAPSTLQLSLFASVIQGFDAQHLRLHDTSTGRLRCEHPAAPGTKITSLDWGYYGTTYRDQNQKKSNKKRKRNTDNTESAVVAFGTSQSEICIFSPSESTIVGKLSGAHERGVKDFKFFGDDYLGGWSIGGDDRLVQWDLKIDQAIRTIILPEPAICTLASSMFGSVLGASSLSQQVGPQVICASTTPYAIGLTSSTEHQVNKFDSFKSVIHSIVRSGDSFLAADSDRHISLYDLHANRILRTLNAGSGVVSLSLSTLEGGKEAPTSRLMAITTYDGFVELFLEPFQRPPEYSSSNGTTKSKQRSLTRKASASIKLVKPDAKANIVQIFQASVQGPDIVIASTDGGVDVSFQKVRWQDEGTGELLFDGVKEVTRTKSASSLKSATMNGVKEVGNVHVDESKAVVMNVGTQGNTQVVAIEISSEDDIDDGSSEVNDEDENKDESDGDAAEGKDMVDPDIQMADIGTLAAVDHGVAEDGTAARGKSTGAEPTFGELLAAKNPNTISIAGALTPTAGSTLVTAGHENSLSFPSGVSLSTVLTQSLRTNDQNLLESCFHATDLDTIRLTVQRLDSSLAGILLQKLAERLSARPGRYGHLLVWVQWTCIAHGGAIAGRPDVSSKIQTLHNVLSDRSKSLPSLLLLKGKLDMLEAQLMLRRQLKEDRGPARSPDDEDDVIYIEGEREDKFSSDEDEVAEARPIKTGIAKRSLHDLVQSETESEDEKMPMTNGMLHSEEEDSDANSSGEVPDLGNGLLDDEAVESDDSHPSDREEDSDEEEEDSDEADSEMDSFINDESVEIESASDVDVDETPEKPPTKKTKRS